MDADRIASLIWFSLLVISLGGWFLLQFRTAPGRALQQIAVWALIFVGLVAGYGLWNDIRSQMGPAQISRADGSIEIPRGPDGHYHATLSIDGVKVQFVIDTGASQIVLSERDARQIGLDPGALAYIGEARTANGVVRTAPVRLASVTLGPFELRDVPAVVNQGQMDGSLLGMSWISQFARVEIAGDRLTLTP